MKYMIFTFYKKAVAACALLALFCSLQIYAAQLMSAPLSSSSKQSAAYSGAEKHTSPETSVPGLYRYTLDNGLSLFVLENNTAPLAFVQIAVRTGAVSQTPQTAGLFHLYEHMMFKGNAKYPDQQAVTSALNKMGVSDWNGSTGIDEVNYYITVPSSLVRDGLEFWSYAIRTPLMNEKELENEKGVVLSEINGNHTDPGQIFFGAVAKNLFAESPWRLDAGGSPDAVRNATVDQLRSIQSTYYVPENAALFVGGDVHHEDVYRVVCDLYGGWKRGSGTVPFKEPSSKSPFSSIRKYVYPDPQCSDSYVQLIYYLRGPDAQIDSSETYAADVWTRLLDNPDGSFKKTFLNDKDLSIPDPDYLSGFYSTQRASGMIGFSAAMINEGKYTPALKADKCIANLTEFISVMASSQEKEWAPQREIDSAKKQIEDSRIYTLETPSGFLSALSAMWASAGADYFFDYDKNISAVTIDDICSFVKEYEYNKNGMAVVFINPELYAEQKKEFADKGYTEINSDTAFWWNEKSQESKGCEK